MFLGSARVLIWVSGKIKRSLEKLLNNANRAEELSESVASMDFEAVSYLDEIQSPTRIQSSFIKIVSVLKLLRPYLPQHLLVPASPKPKARGDDEKGAEEAAPISPARGPGRSSRRASRRRASRRRVSSGSPLPSPHAGDPQVPAFSLPLVPPDKGFGPLDPPVPKSPLGPRDQKQPPPLVISATSSLVVKVATVVAIRCIVVTDVALMQNFVKIVVQAVRLPVGYAIATVAASFLRRGRVGEL